MNKEVLDKALGEICDRYCIWSLKLAAEHQTPLYNDHCSKCPMQAITKELNKCE